MIWEEEFAILYSNLSGYYIVCLIISFSAVLFTICLHCKKNEQNRQEQRIILEQDQSKSNSDEIPTISSSQNVVAKMKMTQQRNIDALNLTEQQLQKEREVESKQLAAIFNLLQEQQDKFQVNSMKELENQLKLYR